MSCVVYIVYTNPGSRLQAAGCFHLCVLKDHPFACPENNIIMIKGEEHDENQKSHSDT